MATTTKTIPSSPLPTSWTLSHLLSDTPSSTELPSLSKILGLHREKTTVFDAESSGAPKFPGFSSAKAFLASLPRSESPEALPPNAKRLGLESKYSHRGTKTKAKPSPSTKFEPTCNEPLNRSEVEVSRKRDKLQDPGVAEKVVTTKTIDLTIGSKPTTKKKAQTKPPQQAKIPKTKVTKPGSRAGRAKSEVKTTESSASGATVLAGDTSPQVDVPSKAPEPTILVESNVAVKRRRDWTPVKDTSKRIRQDPKDTADGSQEEALITTTSSFGQALGGFAFEDTAQLTRSQQLSAKGSQGSSFVKGKQIDLLHEPKRPSIVLERTKRGVSPAKKATTITDKATAPYIAPLGSPEHLQNETITRYLDIDTFSHAQSKPQAMKAVRSKAKGVKTKKPKKEPEIVLLSPTSAVKKALDQEVLFGTSSQLARDESPTYIAIKQSERATIPERTNLVDVNELQVSSGFSALAPSRKLWSAASRDENETLLESEPIVPPARYRNAQLSRDLPQLRKVAETQQDLSLPVCTTHHRKDAGTSRSEEVTVRTNVNKQASGKASETATATASCSDASGQGQSDTSMPDFERFSDDCLKARVSSYGFKAIKRRQDMISLVKKCWLDQQKRKASDPGLAVTKALTETDPNQSMMSKEADTGKKKRATKKAKPLDLDAEGEPLKKRRGRPKKADSTVDGSPKKTAKKTKAVARSKDTKVDDATSEDTTERTVKPKKPPPPKQREHYHSEDAEAALQNRVKACYLEEHSDRILAAISKAVKSQSPTHDMRNLSWHEKIVLYDPIIIEELTDWLTSGPLVAAGELDTPSIFLVKDWCEKKSICCVRKETLRGKDRARW